MKRAPLVIAYLAAASFTFIEAAEPQLTLVKLDATPDAIVHAWPNNPKQEPMDLAQLEKTGKDVGKFKAILLAAVLSTSDAETLLKALGKQAKVMALPNQALAIQATRDKGTPEFLHLVVSDGSSTIVGEFWESHQAPVFAAPDPKDPERTCLYVLQLNQKR